MTPLLAAALSLSIQTLAEDRPVTPEEAARMMGQTVTLEMKVLSSWGVMTGNVRAAFLCSNADRNTVGNFTVLVDRPVIEGLRRGNVDQVRAYFEGKTIQVRGRVSKSLEGPLIIVTEASQIKVVKKK